MNEEISKGDRERNGRFASENADGFVNPYHTHPPDFRRLGERFETFKPL
jgi:hypothetical protein